METEHITDRLVRALDMAAMVIAPICITLPLFKMAFQNYQIARSTGTNYNVVIVLFLVALLGFICFGYAFGKGLKHYVYNQLTMDGITALRIMYSFLIIGGLIIYFIV